MCRRFTGLLISYASAGQLVKRLSLAFAVSGEEALRMRCRGLSRSGLRATGGTPTVRACPPPRVFSLFGGGQGIGTDGAGFQAITARWLAGRCRSYSPAPACLCSCLSAAVSERFDKA